MAPQLPDTRNLTPKFYKMRNSCPEGATFSELSPGKSLVPIYLNHIMFAQELCYRFKLKRQSDTRRKRLRCAIDTTNLQSSIPACPG